MKAKRVLVTGVSAFIGIRLFGSLVEQGSNNLEKQINWVPFVGVFPFSNSDGITL